MSVAGSSLGGMELEDEGGEWSTVPARGSRKRRPTHAEAAEMLAADTTTQEPDDAAEGDAVEADAAEHSLEGNAAGAEAVAAEAGVAGQAGAADDVAAMPSSSEVEEEKHGARAPEPQPATDSDDEAAAVAADGAEESLSLDVHARGGRRGRLWRMVLLVHVLAVCAVAVVMASLLRAPSPPPSKRLARDGWEHQLLAANWMACDRLVAPACAAGRRMVPLEVDVAASATQCIQTLATATNTTAWVSTWSRAESVTSAILSAAVAAQHGLSWATTRACEQLEEACTSWVCTRARRGECFGPSPGCERLRAACVAAADGEEDLGLVVVVPGGVGFPKNWRAPPADWIPLPDGESRADLGGSAPLRVRGAHPWMLETWRAAGTHECELVLPRVPTAAGPSTGASALAASTLLGLESINDDWCDCVDGSDEPGTTACAGRGGRFWCLALPSSTPSARAPVASGEWIDAGLVDDGRCDCCDCSDEQLVAAGAAAPTEACASGLQASRLTPLEPWAATDAVELEMAAATVRAARVNASATIGRMRYDAQAMGEALQRPPRNQQEYHQAQRLAQSHQLVSAALHHGFGEPTVVRAANAAAAAAAARAAANAAGAASGERGDEATTAEMGAHPHEFLPLFGVCVNASLCTGGCSASHDDTLYYWELCPYRHALQAPSEADREAGRATLIGTFAGWSVSNLPSLVTPGAELRAPRALFEFGNGEACWEGPARSASVEMRCGAETELLAVDEDGKCRYVFLLRTPYACGVPWSADEQRAAAAAEAAAAEAAAAEATRAEEEEVEAKAASRSAASDAGGDDQDEDEDGEPAPQAAEQMNMKTKRKKKKKKMAAAPSAAEGM